MKWKNGLLTLSIFIIINGFLFIIHITPTLFYFQFSFEKKMPKQIKIKYFEESVFAKEPVKTTEGSAGYDLFAAEAKTVVQNSSQIVCLDLIWAIRKGFLVKIFHVHH